MDGMKTIIIFLGFMWLVTLNSYAQIQGDVVDTREKGIPNAMIIATDSLTRKADTVKSDHRGFYEFKSLKLGKYKIEIKATGFKTTVIENIIVKEGDIGAYEIDLYRGQRLDITLSPAKLP
jgi:hypothetical protein